MIDFPELPFSEDQILSSIEAISSKINKPTTQELKELISFIDLTSLNAYDTASKVKDLCHRARQPVENDPSVHCAAVCSHSYFSQLLAEELHDSKVSSAVVEGAFPMGMVPLETKLNEVKSILSFGVNEIDIVFNRSLFFDKKYEKASEEIQQISRLCHGKAVLKVILEVSELGTLKNIWKASWLALDGGADFIKTSTGKSTSGATYDSFFTMALAIKQFRDMSGIQKGLKASGGIKSCLEAITYKKICDNVLGQSSVSASNFRIGASSLLNEIIGEIS